MKVSLCVTVLNEEKSIGRLLDSIFHGTRVPDEIVIVDGGSTDATASAITNYQFTIINKFPSVNFQFIRTKRKGIAAGRNLAIKNAKGNIIVQTDAGCVVKRDWLEKITEPFGHSRGVQSVTPDIVAGFYEMRANTKLQAVMNVFHGIPPQRFDPKTFIPSARSCAFRKAVWQKLGGYSEKLKKAGEDTLFFHKAVKNNFQIERVGQARVIWEETANKSFKEFLVKSYEYARGDAKSGIWQHPLPHFIPLREHGGLKASEGTRRSFASEGFRSRRSLGEGTPTVRLGSFMSHNIKASLILARYVVGISLVLVAILGYVSPLLIAVLIFLYLLWPVYKWRDVIKTRQGRLLLPVVQIASDLAVMSGFLWGILEG